MCLYRSERKTKRTRRTFAKNKIRYVWKVLQLAETQQGTAELRSPCFSCGPAWKPGWATSSRKSTRLTRVESVLNEVDKGFHVFLRKADAEKWKGGLEEITVRMTATASSFVAAGKDGDAVFLRVFLSAKEYKHVMALAEQLKLLPIFA